MAEGIAHKWRAQTILRYYNMAAEGWAMANQISLMADVQIPN